MFARENASGGRSLAYVLLYLLHAATAGAQALPNNQYTLVQFADTPDGPVAEYTVSVPNDVQGILRMTDLGCPGERYTIFSGSVPLFQTEQVPANPACVNPLSLSDAPQAFSSGEYSTGQASLPPGDYTIRITPLETASGDAAIGFFSSAAAPEASSGVGAFTDTPPEISVGTAISAEGPSETLADTASPEGLQSTEAPSDTESLSPPDEAGSESPLPVDSPSDSLSSETLTGEMVFPQSSTETPTESSLTGALPEATEDVSSSVAGGANNVVMVTATGYVTVTTTISIAVTTDDDNTVTTTLTDATETVVSTVDSEIAVTETPSPSYTVMTLFTTATSLETLTSEVTIGGNTITVTEVITVIQDVEDYTTITLPATTTTQEETTTVVETSTAFTTMTTSLEGIPDVVTTTMYVTYDQTAIVSDGVTETIPVESSGGSSSDSGQLTPTGETNTESLETVTVTGSEDCTVPVVTSIVDFTLTETAVVLTTALPELTTATETSTVETTTTTISIGGSADQISVDETGTPSSPTASETANFTNEGVITTTNTEAASADETSFPNENSTIFPANVNPLSEPEASTAIVARRGLHSRAGSSVKVNSVPIESTESDITCKLKRHFLRSWVGALLAPDIARKNLAKRQLGEDPEVATVTVGGETPTVTVFVTEVCLPSTTPTGTITTPTESETNSAELSSTESAEPSSTPTPPLPLTCDTRTSNLVLITDVLTFPQARESCRALRLRLGTLRRFNTVVDAIGLLEGCNVTEAWINPASVNTITRPQCFALAKDQWYEPEDCLKTTRPVVCAISR